MKDLEILKNDIINKVEAKFQTKKLDINFKEQFYYPKLIHILKFNIEQYEIENLGNMAILQGTGLGVMKVLTVIFTPSTTKDIPLVIIDFIKMANKRTVLVEFYSDHITHIENVRELENNLKNINSKYKDIKDYIESLNWYTLLRNEYSPLKMTTKKDDSRLYEMVLENLDEYLNYSIKVKVDTNKRNTQLESFINDLIYKGNPSTSVLEKALGKEETIRLFKEIIFNYK